LKFQIHILSIFVFPKKILLTRPFLWKSSAGEGSEAVYGSHPRAHTNPWVDYQSKPCKWKDAWLEECKKRSPETHLEDKRSKEESLCAEVEKA
jgi:hypothetical protein